MARRTHDVDGTGISVGVLSDGVDALAAQQATGEVPAGVTVLPGQAGGAISLSCNRRSKGTEGTAMLEIVHDLAPGAELFFATGINGAAQMAQNIEDLCAAGANVIVDDIGYLLAPAFQDGVIAQAVSSVVADGCYYFSAAGNGGNLNDSTSGVWEGDFVAGPELILNGVPTGAVIHDFDPDPDNDVTRNIIVKDSFLPIVLQWADPWGKSANDYDLFLIDADDNVLASSTNTQDGTQDDPIEFISGSCSNDRVQGRSPRHRQERGCGGSLSASQLRARRAVDHDGRSDLRPCGLAGCDRRGRSTGRHGRRLQRHGVSRDVQLGRAAADVL